MSLLSPSVNPVNERIRQIYPIFRYARLYRRIQMTHVVEPAMTVRDVAAFLNVDEKTIYRLAQHGDLPGFKVLGSWRFQRLDLEAWIAERKELAASVKKLDVRNIPSMAKT
jgi:excisionase family DNA binding protein